MIFTQVLTSIFLDEWNGFIQLKLSSSPILKFRIFGKDYAVSFRNLVTTEMNLYLSVGGKFGTKIIKKSFIIIIII